MRDDLLTMLKLKHSFGAKGADTPESELMKRITAAERVMPPSVLDRVTKQLADTLPVAEKKYGINHPSYLFYIDLLMVCIWCNRYMGITEDASLRIANLKLEINVLREQLIQAEKDLNRYATVEDMLMNGTIDTYMRVVLERIGQHVPDHPRVQAFAAALDLIDMQAVQAAENNKGKDMPSA